MMIVSKNVAIIAGRSWKTVYIRKPPYIRRLLQPLLPELRSPSVDLRTDFFDEAAPFDQNDSSLFLR
jgi:hypothetical protein